MGDVYDLYYSSPLVEMFWLHINIHLHIQWVTVVFSFRLRTHRPPAVWALDDGKEEMHKADTDACTHKRGL